ncbi:MAG: hypothetical protein ABW200_16805 [Hyphomicrobiaceae bacterium]
MVAISGSFRADAALTAGAAILVLSAAPKASEVEAVDEDSLPPPQAARHDSAVSRNDFEIEECMSGTHPES